MGTVKFTNVRKQYGAAVVVPDLNLTIDEGSFTVLVGPSGCGKSTILRMIAGLEDISEGKLEIDGEDLTYAEPKDRGIAMVFQSYALYPHMTVRENIGFGMTIQKRSKSEIKEAIDKAAEILQLTDYLDRKPAALSGGQRQRVAIGRAITRNPKVFLFDEPLSNLDASLRGQMRVELTELHKKIGATMVYVTHDQVEAMTMADKIVVLNKGQIEQQGRPMDLYNRPETPFVAGFIGSPKMNLIEGERAKPFGCEVYGIRPEHIDIVNKGGEWTGTVRHVELLGADTITFVDVKGMGQITVRSEGEINHDVGTSIKLTPREGKAHRFVNNAKLD